MAIEHGKNLGLFVFSYKAGYKLLNNLIKPSSFNHFVSGLIFGALIFGKKTGVNHQIVLYLFSRVAIALATLLYRKFASLNSNGNGKINFIEKDYGYYLLSAVCWGIVMWLFEKDKSTLQPSLKNSMEFLYKESDRVESLIELIPYYPKENKKTHSPICEKKDERILLK
jgi:peroxisomal membrane protein 4